MTITSAGSTVIKQAQPGDASTLLLLCRRFHDESSYSGIAFSESKALAVIVQALDQSPDKYVKIVEFNGQLVGFLAATLYAPMFSEEKVALEIGWWIDPVHRKGRAGLELVRDFEKWATSKQARVIQMSALGTSGEQVTNFYTRLGYKLVETTWHKRIR